MRESEILTQLRLEASRLGITLFRNNIGMFQGEDGRVIKYGVCNPGGSDLIGWTPIKILPRMIGEYLPIFTAIEAKTQTGKISKAQTHFLEVLKKANGIAILARNITDLQRGIYEFRKD